MSNLSPSSGGEIQLGAAIEWAFLGMRWAKDDVFSYVTR